MTANIWDPIWFGIFSAVGDWNPSVTPWIFWSWWHFLWRMTGQNNIDHLKQNDKTYSQLFLGFFAGIPIVCQEHRLTFLWHFHAFHVAFQDDFLSCLTILSHQIIFHSNMTRFFDKPKIRKLEWFILYKITKMYIVCWRILVCLQLVLPYWQCVQWFLGLIATIIWQRFDRLIVKGVMINNSLFSCCYLQVQVSNLLHILCVPKRNKKTFEWFFNM